MDWPWIYARRLPHGAPAGRGPPRDRRGVRAREPLGFTSSSCEAASATELQQRYDLSAGPGGADGTTPTSWSRLQAAYEYYASLGFGLSRRSGARPVPAGVPQADRARRGLTGGAGPTPHHLGFFATRLHKVMRSAKSTRSLHEESHRARPGRQRRSTLLRLPRAIGEGPGGFLSFLSTHVTITGTVTPVRALDVSDRATAVLRSRGGPPGTTKRHVLDRDGGRPPGKTDHTDPGISVGANGFTVRMYSGEQLARTGAHHVRALELGHRLGGTRSSLPAAATAPRRADRHDGCWRPRCMSQLALARVSARM